MTLGWAEISDRDVRAAAQSLRAAGDGVVDEVGVRVLHSLYANRFYPGVSVQQTRLRYVLLVPWILETLAARSQKGNDVRSGLRKAEPRLAQLLLDGGETDGVIGGSTREHVVKLPPSQSYWGLMQVLGIVPFDPVRGRAYSLAEVIEAWPDSKRKGLTDDEGRSLGTSEVFPSAGLPCPARLLETPTQLALSAKEREHLSQLFEGVCSFGHAGLRLALIARMASAGAPAIRPGDLLAIGGADARNRAAELGWEQGDVLERAAKAASLAAVVRAVYAALVEGACEGDGLTVGTSCRDALATVVQTHGVFAANLDLHAVRGDAPGWHGSHRRLQPGTFGFRLFDETLASLRAKVTSTPRGLAALRPAYQHAEVKRKKALARLPPTPQARTRRRDWKGAEFVRSDPLHYRSYRVQDFLDDLRGERG